MLPRLRLRKTRRRLTSNSKGFSSIVGAVFAALVMISLISTVFVWSLSQNTLYNNAVRQSNLADLDRSNERILSNVTCNRIDDGLVSVNGTLENYGPLSVQIVTLWVMDANNTNYAYKTPLDMTLAPGDITTLSEDTAIDVSIANSVNDSLSCWFISGRGNTFSEKSTTIINNYSNVTGIPPYAYVAGGIGSISMDFKQFCHYHPLNSNNGTDIGSASYTYTIPRTMTIFHLVLTNYDITNETIYLSSSSYMWAPSAFSSTVKSDSWWIMNVTGHKIISGFTSLPLPWGQQVEVYFGTNPAVWVAGNVAPMNILLFGKIGSGSTADDYGQNLPFIALNFL